MKHVTTGLLVCAALAVVGCGSSSTNDARAIDQDSLTRMTFHLPGMNRKLKIY